jgi:hypothetical protein
MIVAMMQPTFLPWAGYFAIMDACDQFVVLDDFQFQRQSFHQRNRLFVSGASVGWVTVPVEHRGSQGFPLLTEVRPLVTRRFAAKLARLVGQNYGFSSELDRVTDLLSSALARQWDSLADLNTSLISGIASLLGVTAVLIRSSDVGSGGRRSHRVADLLRKIGATTYLAAGGAEEYMRKDGVFPLEDIETRFQRYSPVPYPQRQSAAFEPHLSALDVLLQLGGSKALATIRAGHGESAAWRSVAART